MVTPVQSSSSDTDAVARWVAVVDAVTVGATLLAFIVAIGGGFRLWLGGIRVSVTSPAKLLAFAVAIGLIRHAWVRRPTLLSRVRVAARRVYSTDEWQAVWPAFAVTRVMVLAVGLLAVYTVGFPTPNPPYRIAMDEITNLPVRWDAGWYLDIASRGYTWKATDAATQQNVAFFPAFPAITWVVAKVFGNSLSAYVAGGLVVSHVAFLWALLYFYRLARVDLGSDDKAVWAVRLLAAYPFSLFHGAMYTESLFLLGCVGALVELRNNRPLRAAAWGLLVGLSRPNGFLLAVTLATFAGPSLLRTGRALWTRHNGALACVIVAPVAGMLAYSTYLAWLTGNPFQWSAQHAAWGRTFKGLAPFVDVAGMIAHEGVGRYVSTAPYDALNAAAVAVALVLVFPIWRAFGLAYALFVCVNVIPPLVKGGSLSMGRLSSTLFPLFLYLALKCSHRSALWLMFVFGAFQAFLAVLFYTWRPMF